MQSGNRELWAAFIAIVVITLAYLGVVVLFSGIPAASSFFGHSIGVLGFILMLMTETLYSIRKRSRQARWGRMADWLNFHIFTGLVGPYMVLLHSSWKFNGLAGIVTLLTAIVVFSGFIGRYIYTAVPRTIDGAAIERAELARQLAELEQELQAAFRVRPALAGASAVGAAPAQGEGGLADFLLVQPFRNLGERLRWAQVKAGLRREAGASAGPQIERIEAILWRRNLLARQVGYLAAARRLLAVWHAVHIPIGMALFTAAFIHIAAALYYATTLRIFK